MTDNTQERQDESESTQEVTDKDQQAPASQGGSSMEQPDGSTQPTPNGNPQTSETISQ
ncbi:hypothetical protein H3C66_03045 [Patescibacteria group bacterium]|nr:hypothetical protein [Patescibacteria group bacterium]